MKRVSPFSPRVLNEAFPSPNNPYLRQLDFWNPARHNPHVLVVGAGGIGSWVVVQLAKLGVSKITVYDADHVSPHNLSTTVYRPADIGKLKVEALVGAVRRMELPAEIRSRPVIYKGQSLRGYDVVISAVDSMAARKLLFQEARRQKVPFYVDGRIGGENLRVYAVRPSGRKDARLYRSTIVPDSQASELPCTGQQISDVNGMTASLIVRAVRKWVAERTYVPEVMTTMTTLQFVIAPSLGGRRAQPQVRTQRRRQPRRDRASHRAR